MRRDQLEHILRAASRVTEERDLLVIGSQAILGSFSEDRLPPQAIRSMEADIALLEDPDETKADKVDGAIGEGSRFHEEFGVYAQGVSVRTAVLPQGWQGRLVVVSSENTRPGRGLCLERHDLVLSKLVRGSTRDIEFAAALLGAGLLDPATIAARVGDLPVDEAVGSRIRAWLRGRLRGAKGL